jgi:hypothetical protein
MPQSRSTTTQPTGLFALRSENRQVDGKNPCTADGGSDRGEPVLAILLMDSYGIACIALLAHLARGGGGPVYEPGVPMPA